MKSVHHLDISVIEQYDPQASDNISYLNSLNLLSVGVVPYPRIIPGLFLDTYQIYSAAHPTEVDILKQHFNIFTLAERKPKEAEKVHALSYLVGNFYFKRFVETRRQIPTLLFSSASNALLNKTTQQGYNFVATKAEVSERFKTKKAFREALKTLQLPHIPHQIVTHDKLVTSTYTDFCNDYQAAAVIQRAEKEVGGNEGTFFILNETDFTHCQKRLQDETEDTTYIISPYIVGDSVSIAGCITNQGTLTGALQLQLIDVPESLHGIPANGTFYGNDWGYKSWGDDIQVQAEHITEVLGAELAKEGFTGIFGLDFMYDSTNNCLYPIECNPRITGSMPAHSLMLLTENIPPFEYYHLLALTNRDKTFDFTAANNSLKTTSACSHISFSPVNINKMEIDITAGVYSFDSKTDVLRFKRDGFHYQDIQNDDEFIIIDTVPKYGEKVQQQVPGFFKFMFPHQIATSSHCISKRAGRIMDIFSQSLLDPLT